LVVLHLTCRQSPDKGTKAKSKEATWSSNYHQINQLLRSVIAVCTRKCILAYPYHGPLWSFAACHLL
jgi:hypothetical protein